MKDDDRRAPPIELEPEEGGGTIDGECVLVPEGEYELRYVDYETANYFGQAKVIVHYSIIEPEEYAGLPVDRFYNAKKLKGPPCRFGKYEASRRGDLVREYRSLIGNDKRLDRLRFASLKNQRIIGRIESVTTDYNRDPLPKSECYSRIMRLVRVLPGDDW